MERLIERVFECPHAREGEGPRPRPDESPPGRAKKGLAGSKGFILPFLEELFECSLSRDAAPRDAEERVMTWFLVVLVPVVGLLLIRMR